MEDPDETGSGGSDGPKLGCTDKLSYSEGDRQTTRIVLIGRRGSGKRSTGNTILGKDAFQASCGASCVTEKCQAVRSVHLEQQILLIDTQGVFDTRLPNKQSLSEISKCINLSMPGPHVFLLVIQAERFTEAENATVKHLADVYGEDMFKHTIVVFTGRDLLEAQDKSFEEYLKTIPCSLEEILRKCKRRCICIDNRPSNAYRDKDASNLVVKINELVESHQNCYYTNDMFHAVERNSEESEEIRRQKDEEKQEEIGDFKKEMQQSRKDAEILNRMEREVEIQCQKDERKQKVKDDLKTESQQCREELHDTIYQRRHSRDIDHLETESLKKETRSCEKELPQYQEEIKHTRHQCEPTSLFPSDIDESLILFGCQVYRIF